MFDFLSIRKSIAALQDRRDALSLEGQELERQLNQVQFAASHKSDIKAIVDSWVNTATTEFVQAVEYRIASNFRNDRSCNLREFGFLSLVAEQDGLRFNSKQLDGAMCAVFGPQIKQAIFSVIDNMDWPGEGLSRDKRAAEVSRLKKRRREVEEQLASLNRAAEEAGVKL